MIDQTVLLKEISKGCTLLSCLHLAVTSELVFHVQEKQKDIFKSIQNLFKSDMVMSAWKTETKIK